MVEKLQSCLWTSRSKKTESTSVTLVSSCFRLPPLILAGVSWRVTNQQQRWAKIAACGQTLEDPLDAENNWDTDLFCQKQQNSPFLKYDWPSADKWHKAGFQIRLSRLDFVTFDGLVHHHLTGFAMATAPPTMKATTGTFDIKMVPLVLLNFQAGQYIPL